MCLGWTAFKPSRQANHTLTELLGALEATERGKSRLKEQLQSSNGSTNRRKREVTQIAKPPFG